MAGLDQFQRAKALEEKWNTGQALSGSTGSGLGEQSGLDQNPNQQGFVDHGKFQPMPTPWHTCPNCGYCLHCGRSSPTYIPTYPVTYPTYPVTYTQYPNYNTPMCVGAVSAQMY
jgi:hypothetical protein